MTSPIQKVQRKKERKVFDSFSSILEVGHIKQIKGLENSYPDGVLTQKIAIEQTDFYHYKTGKASSYKKYQTLLSKIEEQLSKDGYKGCVGIKLNLNSNSIDTKDIPSDLMKSIKGYIDNSDNCENNPLIEKIHFCPTQKGDLVIKEYACDTSSLTFCENISLEEIIERIKEKEEKLKNCKTEFFQHWLIISVQFPEYVCVKTNDYKPIRTFFDKVFIQTDDMHFEKLKTVKKRRKSK